MKEKVILQGGETAQDIIKDGVSRMTAWRALQRGWYYREYKSYRAANEGYGSGLFASIPDVIGFTRAAAIRAIELVNNGDFEYDNVEDYGQDAALRLWEMRDREVSNPLSYAMTVAKNHVRNKIETETRRRRILSGVRYGREINQ